MFDLDSRLALKERLPRTWPAFFERHGNFTPVQLAAMPVLLDGHNAIISAPTAGGKTEAAMAPLVERHCRPAAPAPAILYLVPTRALVNDLLARLELPLQALHISLGVKTRDRTTWRPNRPPNVLITTPESADSLLASQARLFASLRAVVIDELHLLDGTPRGDQLRVILNRLRRVRGHAHERGDAPDAALQFVALSASFTHPAAVAARYFDAARVVDVGGTRALDVERIGLSADGTGELRAYLQTFGAKGWRKALAFCNSRAEVEAYAAAVRGRPPFGGAVFVHYSNIEARRRRDIEQQFAAADAAICFASSTLELGIDIGSIDVVILLGPPGDAASFIQRVGRGNRRGGVTRVACVYRTPLERLLFHALAGPALDVAAPALDVPVPNAPFRPAVAIQQIFSLLKQSPSGAVRPAELASLFEGMLSPEDLEMILGQLHHWEYLTVGRPGEWRAGRRLNELLDRQASAYCSLSIYGNIQGSEGRQIDIRDGYTHETVARVDAQWLDRPMLTLEGRPLTVAWYDGEAMWVVASQDDERAQRQVYRSERQLLSYDVARLLPLQLGLPVGAAPFIAARDERGVEKGWWWFHWLGDLYGYAMLDLLRYRIPATETAQPGLCVYVPGEPAAAPAWTEAQVKQYLHDAYRKLEPMLALGPYQRLLPAHLRRAAVVEHFDVARFVAAVAALRLCRAPEELAEDLADLVLPGRTAGAGAADRRRHD